MRHVGKRMDRQADRRQRNGRMNMLINKPAVQTNGQTDGQINSNTGGQVGRRTDFQIDS